MDSNTEWEQTNIWRYLTDPKVDGNSDTSPRYAYRYMGSDGLLATVTSRTVRFNAWSQMNDPRESMCWSAKAAVAGGTYTDEELRTRLDDVLRRSARLISLTVDRSPSCHAEPGSLFHKGWARAASWAHYAQAHHGACLVLDLPALSEELEEMQVVVGRYRTQGRVSYQDGPIDVGLTGSYGSSEELESALEDLLDKRSSIPRLHMKKNTDWAYETEWRIAAIDLHLPNDELDTPLYVPLGKCLKAVIFGKDHPAPWIVARGIEAEMGPDAPEFFQCGWDSGTPTLKQLLL